MFYYKDDQSRVHVLDDRAFEYLLPDGCKNPDGTMRLIDEEAAKKLSDAAANRPPTVQQQIQALEATATPRRLREAALGTDGGWLAKLDAEIAELRKQLS